MIQINLMKGDCLELMKTIPDKSVDMVLTDPPYGTTVCKWDSVIPFDKMWAELKRIVKNERSAIVLFGSEPFSSLLRTSNLKEFRYDWIWRKSRFANQMLAKKQPLKTHELISVFSESSHDYYPQGLVRVDKITKQGSRITDNNNGGTRATEYRQEFTNYPRSVLDFKSQGKTVHSTQKPVDLLEFLVKTYTQENETVLDFTMGSGSVGIACKNTGRNFIGIERDDKYFEIAKQRIEQV